MAKSKKKYKLNLSEVEVGGIAVPDGRYKAHIYAYEEKEGQDSGKPYLQVKWKILGPAAKGATVYDNFSLVKEAWWKIKKLLIVMGENIPKGTFEWDPEDLLERPVDIEIVNEKYEGKDRPRVTDYYELDDERIGKASDDDEKDDDDDNDDDDDEKDDDEKDDDDEKEKEEEKPRKKKKKSSDDESEGKFKVGTKVKFKDDDGKTVKGVILSLDDDTAKIKDSDGDTWTDVGVDELTAI